ncbi:cytidylyltransferase domain-containing protein [Chloroflexota bacterium]
MTKDVKVGVFIAVRMNSTRLPQKALLDIEGKTLIAHLIERVKKSNLPNIIVVCTSTHPDDAILTAIAKQAGVKAFTGSETDVAARFLEAAREERVDVIVRVTGDCPLIDPEHIDRAITHLLASDADYVRIIGMPIGTHCEVFYTGALQRICDLAGSDNYSEYLTFYFINNPEIFHIEEIECDEGVNRPSYRLTVDEIPDAELMRKIYGHLYQGRRVFSLKEVIELLDSRPDLLAINQNVKLKWRDEKAFVKLLNEKTRF